MTTLKEFNHARSYTAASEPSLRTGFAHSRGFRSGADWTADRIAGAAEALKQAVDSGIVDPADALANLAVYARNHQKLAQSRKVQP